MKILSAGFAIVLLALGIAACSSPGPTDPAYAQWSDDEAYRGGPDGGSGHANGHMGGGHGGGHM
jgi:hypothetical protein